MTDREALVQQLIDHEGLRLKPYVDTVGKTTIGVGRNLTDVGISRDEALALLEHDIDAAIADLAASFGWFASLDAIRQRAVVDMRFNLGAGGIRTFVHFLHAMAIGDYVGAARELRSSKWATQVGDRAQAIAAMIETGTD